MIARMTIRSRFSCVHAHAAHACKSKHTHILTHLEYPHPVRHTRAAVEVTRQKNKAKVVIKRCAFSTPNALAPHADMPAHLLLEGNVFLAEAPNHQLPHFRPPGFSLQDVSCVRKRVCNRVACTGRRPSAAAEEILKTKCNGSDRSALCEHRSACLERHEQATP